MFHSPLLPFGEPRIEIESRIREVVLRSSWEVMFSLKGRVRGHSNTERRTENHLTGFPAAM